MKKNILILMLIFSPFLVFAQKDVLEFKEMEFDFGTIKEEGGKVTHIFEFKNNGRVPIIINSVKASCGCTTPLWTKKPVLPNKVGLIKVTYNPLNRPSKFIKTVTVTTNVATKKLVIKGLVTPRPKTIAELYPKKMEELRLTTSYVMFNEIGNKQKKKIEVKVINDSKENITLSFAKIPDYVSIKMKNKVLKPKEKGVIEVTYLAKNAKFWGFHSDLIPLLVNGKKRASNNLVVTATVIEDFSGMSKKDMEKAPLVGVDKFEANFNSAIAGDKVKTQFKLTNIGKSPLVLRSVDGSYQNLKIEISETKIAPDKQAIIDVTFDTSGKKGYQNQQITLITNAPDLPILTLRIIGIVE